MPLCTKSPDAQLIELDNALQLLRKVYPKHAKLVELRFFGGMTNEEVAKQLNISTATTERYWVYAKAWLRKAMD